jgi:hypothetical protein
MKKVLVIVCLIVMAAAANAHASSAVDSYIRVLPVSLRDRICQDAVPSVFTRNA